MTERVCTLCGESFLPHAGMQKTCSAECRHAAKLRRQRDYLQRIAAGPPRMADEQVCQICRERLPAAAYHKNRASPTGLNRACKSCRAAYDQRPDQAALSRSRHHVKYLRSREEILARSKARHEAHREARNAACRARYHADLEASRRRARDRERAKKEWEAADARRCVCGKALPPGDEEDGQWFCRAACKVRCIRHVCGQAQDHTVASLIDTIRQLQTSRDAPRITEAEEAMILGIAKNTARRWQQKGSGALIDDADLLSAAYLGAWNAWLSHDPKKGGLRNWLITGARREVLEALRAVDPLSRGERDRHKAEAAEARAKRLPEPPPPRVILSLDQPFTGPEEEPLFIADTIPDPDDTLARVVEREAAKATAARVMALFTPREQKLKEVVRLIGLEGLTHARTAEMLGLSPTRIHQLWEEAKGVVRERLGA